MAINGKELEMPFIRSAYNYDRDRVSNETGLKCVDESRTKQSFAEEADINRIVERFGLGGQVPVLDHVPDYVDYDEVFDFHSAMNVVAAAREQFERIPAQIRARFRNDPQEFLDFCAEPENRPELKKMGLLKDPPVDAGEPAKPAAAVVPPPPGSPAGGQKGGEGGVAAPGNS